MMGYQVSFILFFLIKSYAQFTNLWKILSLYEIKFLILIWGIKLHSESSTGRYLLSRLSKSHGAWSHIWFAFSFLTNTNRVAVYFVETKKNIGRFLELTTHSFCFQKKEKEIYLTYVILMAFIFTISFIFISSRCSFCQLSYNFRILVFSYLIKVE